MGHKVSWVRNLILAIILVVLGYGAFYWEYKKRPATEEQEVLARKVFQLKDTSVKALKIQNAGQTISFTCLDFAAKLCKPTDHSKWEMTEPKKLRADDANVNSLLSTLEQLDQTSSIELKGEKPEKKATLLKEYGLDPESRKKAQQVQITTEKGDTTLYIGHDHPVGESFFAYQETVAPGQTSPTAESENQVYILPKFFKSNIEHDLTHWRNKKLSTVATHEIASFTLKGTRETISGERKNGQWTLRSKAGEFPGDSEVIEQALSSVTQLSAKDFVSDSKTDAKAKAALKGLSPTITLTLQKEMEASDKDKDKNKEAPAPITFTFYQKAAPGKKPSTAVEGPPKGERLFATVSNLDPLFELDPFSKGRFDKAMIDLRQAKLISSMDRFSAKTLEFSGTPIGSPPLVLTLADGKWKIESDKTEVVQEKVQTLLDRLSGDRIFKFLTGSEIPPGEKEGLILRLGDDKDKAKREFVFWKKDKKFYGRDLKSQRKEAFVFEAPLMEALPWTKDFFTQPKKEERGPEMPKLPEEAPRT